MAYTEPNKIVFVGDACQLPPVAKTPISGALNPTFLSERYGVQCTGFELREIQRQKADNQILQMAGFFRKGIESASFIKYPKLEAVRGNSQFTVLHSSEDDLIKSYVQCIRQQGYKKQIMLTNSNWKCLELNRIIRSGLGFSGLLLKGDLLMVVQNSYSVPLANGDLAEVLDVREKGCRAGLRFLEVEVCTLHNNQVFKTLLLADFLNNDSPALPQHNFKALLIDFDQRMRNLKIKRKTNRYVQEMMTDPYLNALRAKYGYVITCHKAQGGEWLEVYLLIHKSLFALRDAVLYRWFYTALTRASDKVHIHRDWWVKEV
jgi:ATP-dependent exoDNAse (exonuclease V) alpha subunit